MPAGDGVVSEPDMLPYIVLTRAIEVAQEHGCNIQSDLDKAGLSEILASGDRGEIPRQNYYRFIESLLARYTIPAFGLQVGQRFSVADYGILGYAFISSPTLGKSLQTFFRFQQIVGADASFLEELRVEDHYAIIRINCKQTASALYRFEVEEGIGQWSVSGVILEDGSNLVFSKVHFAFPKPCDHQFLEERLNCPVFYDQKDSEIYISSALLNQRFSMANEVTAQLCELQCEKILHNFKAQGGLVEQVRRLIINNPGELPDPNHVASQLNLSYRSLRRHLREEGASFKEIHNDVRMGMATEYLTQTTLSTQEIAFILGYSEVTNFHRAFKKLNNMTPGKYRESSSVL